MPLARYSLAAAAAACLLGGLAVAYADTPPAPPASDAQSPSGMQQPDQNMPPPAAAQPSAGADTSMQGGANTGASSDTSANVSNTQVIASQPVPDTKANRARYGQPMSRAGKRTAASGD